MIDVKLIRENPSLVRKNFERRKNVIFLKMLDEFIELDGKWRKALQELESLRRRKNSISTEINAEKKAGKDTVSLMGEAKNVSLKTTELEKEVNSLQEKLHGIVYRLPNLLHESVPFGKDETENKELKRGGAIKKFSFEPMHHGELALKLDGADFERAVKISGTGFYFLKNEIALLDLALQKFAIDELMKKGFSLIEPPLMLKKQFYEGVTALEDFEQVMYKIDSESSFLIATSEHPLVSMHANEIFSEEELPIRYVGVSPCFRREVGKHGLDERGFFRVHHFSKVEQVILCTPENSWDHFNELIKNAEGFFKKLALPYRVVDICTGDIGIVAAKKCDIEVWSPREKKFFEVHSGSNCTDFQARRLNIKYRKGPDKFFVHTLNSTAIATSRALRAILENHQTKEGTVKVPKVLRGYMNGLKEIIPTKPKKKIKGKLKKRVTT